MPLGKAIVRLCFDADASVENLIGHDDILIGADTAPLVTGSELLGRLFQVIVRHAPPAFAPGCAPLV
jgi:hypothetical protein